MRADTGSYYYVTLAIDKFAIIYAGSLYRYPADGEEVYKNMKSVGADLLKQAEEFKTQEGKKWKAKLG